MTPLVKVWTRDGAIYRHIVSGGTVTTYESLRVEIVHNAPGLWSLTLPMDHLQAGVFLKRGKKAWVTFDLPDRGVRYTGKVTRMVPYRTDEGRMLLDVSGVGALNLLNLLCFPAPGASAEAQLLTNYTDLGAAEDVLRRLIQRNAVERRGLPLTVAASQGRGAQQGLNLWLSDPMLEVVTSVATRKGLGVRAGLVDDSPASTTARMVVDFYAPRDQRKRATLTTASGTVRSWSQEEVAPTATHAIVAAGYRERTYDVIEVGLESDTIVTTVPHRLWTGDVVRFSGKADPPQPLQEGQPYFAIRAGASIFKVAETRAKALAGQAINLTAGATAGRLQVTEITRTVREVPAPGTEATDWDMVSEVFVDARNVAEDEALSADVTEAGLDGLTEHTNLGSAEVVTTESEFIRFGAGDKQLYLGDLGRLQLVEEWGRDDRLTAATLTVTRDAGAAVELVFGSASSSPLRRQAELYKALQRRIRHLEQGS